MRHNLDTALPPCRIPSSTRAQLEQWARRNQMSLSTAVRQAILRLLAEECADFGSNVGQKSKKEGAAND